MSELKKITESNFLIVGLVRNCEGYIKTEIDRIKNALSMSNSINWLLIESDSEDSTLEVLERISGEIKDFRYISLGNLRDKNPKRTARLAICRNAYLKEINNNSIYDSIDFVIIADLDDLNTDINQEGINSCWLRNDWDVVSANQGDRYYDIWALRHELWSPNDCWAQYSFLSEYISDKDKLKYGSVGVRQITIPPDSDWIEVDSAFGGFAIYKKYLFQYGEYIGLTSQGRECCEHVSFHQLLKENGAKLFINPKLINTNKRKSPPPFIKKNIINLRAEQIITSSRLIYNTQEDLSKFSNQFLFHTDLVKNPYVVFDLASILNIKNIIINNRKTNNQTLLNKAKGLQLFISIDLLSWEHVNLLSQNDFKVFSAEINKSFRYIRLSLIDDSVLHLHSIMLNP